MAVASELPDLEVGQQLDSRSRRTREWAQPLSNNGLKLNGAPVRIYQADQPWQHSLIEAPQMVISPSGTVFLFYSASGFAAPDYAMGAAQCAGPVGPCRDVSPSPLVASNSQGPGPGEETAFTAGRRQPVVGLQPMVQRRSLYPILRPAEAIRIAWNSSGPYVAEAGAFPLASVTRAAACLNREGRLKEPHLRSAGSGPRL